MSDSIERWQWRKIIEKMYDEDDFRQLEAQIKYRISLQKTGGNEDPSGSPTTSKKDDDDATSKRSMRASANSR